MNANIPMKSEERISLLLRALYEQYGYAQYKMSKFEEYDLYVSNKDFLISDSVITFTDTNGKLMALKPDMTLSIVKNTKDAPGTLSKVYYDENVYRVSKGTHSFKEIKQVGLECIGDLDAYSLYEVLMLAAESLQSISTECVLDISHLGILSGVLESLGVSESVQGDLLRCMGEKNPHELTAICKANAIKEEDIDLLKALVSLYGAPKEVLPKLATLLEGKIDGAILDSFTAILEAFQGSPLQSMLRIDFSVVSDMHYY
ncbi:MAG: ATP phosphoribosyltransferase regulatory subunit, partial [Clostridia bacterium]|nr:ATP phosphoribosyltransferase regulatory subunit [Clostridia bacterium]